MPKQLPAELERYNFDHKRSLPAHLQRKTVFWLFAPVHRANFKGQQRVELSRLMFCRWMAAFGVKREYQKDRSCRVEVKPAQR
jgi:hypothetical protein